MQTLKNKIRLTDVQRLLVLLNDYVRPYWKSMVVFFALNLLATFFAAVLPLIMAPILDAVLGKSLLEAGGSQGVTLGNLSLKNIGAALMQWLDLTMIKDPFHIVATFGGLYILVGLLKSITNFCGYLMGLYVRVRSARDMQLDLFRHILGLSLGFFFRQKSGELMSRIDNDTQATTSGFQTLVGNLVMAPLLVLFYGTLLLRTSPKLACIAGAGALMHYGLTKAIQKPVRRNLADQFSAFAALRARLQETLSGIRVVKSFCAEHFEIKKLRSAISDLIRTNMKFGVFKHVEKPVREVFNRAVEVGILLFCAYELLNGRLDASTFFMFLYVGRSIITPISDLGTTLTSIQNTLAASDRVFELFDEQPGVKDGPRTIQNFSRAIELQNVSFSYDGRTEVLKEVSLNIGKGEIVALVGPSGAGKSTLADLLLRFYDPAAGTVLIDGSRVTGLQQSSYRRLFGVVPQDPLLFNTTIRENIVYGREGISEEALVQSAQIANAHEFIEKLPDGYDTLVGDRGVRLSGGQRQRIAIARSIVSRPQILILDEATSSLDSESEKLVQEATDRIMESSTALVIAHRLSTVLHSDKIVVMDKGVVVDMGSHDELLSRCALYSRLCALQFDLNAHVNHDGNR